MVDPSKVDFYAMDGYRRLRKDHRAAAYAAEVIEASTDGDGTECGPMRIAEARITQGVVAVRTGEVEHALTLRERARCGARKSLPSLMMVFGELTRVLADHYSAEPEVNDYPDQIRALKASWCRPDRH